MKRVLLVSGHPDLEASHTNRVIIEKLVAQMPEVSVRRLDRLYPDYRIDVAVEQQALLDADVVVLQFPFYWYSVPALMKKWIDDVFSYGFAYGSTGDKLHGKDLLLSITIGGPEEAYSPLGSNHFSPQQLLRPLEQTAYLSGMRFGTPVVTHRMVYIPGVYNTLDAVLERAGDHAVRLSAALLELAAGQALRTA